MSASDLIILDRILGERRTSIAPEMEPADFFELFCAQQVLRDYAVGADELQSGIVGGGNDGGIDGMYLLIDGMVVRDPENAAALKTKHHVDFDVIFIQATQEKHFEVARILRIKDTASEIFDLGKDISAFTETPNQQLRNCIETFRVAHERMATSFPNLKVSFFYITRGDTSTVQAGGTLDAKARAVETAMPEQLATISACSFTFVGARGLIELATKPPKQVFRGGLKNTAT